MKQFMVIMIEKKMCFMTDVVVVIESVCSFSSSSSSSSSLFGRKRDQDLDVRCRKHSCLSIERSLKPVVVNLLHQDQDVSFFEGQFSWVFSLEVIQGLSTGSSLYWRSSWRSNRRRKGRC